MVDAGGVDGRRNRVLAALPEPVYQECVQHLVPVDLEVRHSLFEPDEEIRRVYFPLTAVASLVVVMSNTSTAMRDCGRVEDGYGGPVYSCYGRGYYDSGQAFGVRASVR